MSKVASNKSEIVQEIPLACADEDAAVEFMEKMRWDDDPACPHCGDTDVYKMTKRGSDKRNERYLWRCRGCGKQYTVRIGTVMQDSPIPLKHWCYAFWRACTSKKGVSAKEIQRQTGLTYKSALFMMHRIRHAMEDHTSHPLDGVVEVDETYVGGKPRYKGESKRGRGTKKTPVVALVERDGRVKASPVTDVTANTLKNAIRESVKQTARIITDELGSYTGIGPEYEGGHDTIRHSSGEYVNGDIHTHTVEGFFALLKRGIYGVFHNVSKKHLHRYVAEFSFRYNTRNMDDGDRTREAIRQAEGKRLMYKTPIGATS